MASQPGTGEQPVQPTEARTVNAEGPAPRDANKYVDDDETNVSPEEQAQYDQFMENAINLIYEGEQVRPQILEALNVGGEPSGGADPWIMALAQSAVTIVTKLDDSSREAGQPVSDDVLLHGAIAVIEELAEVADAAQIHDYTEQDMTGALQQAIDLYRPKLIADGRTDEETLKAQFAEINQAEAAGRLDEVLPGLSQAEQAAPGEPPVRPKQ